MSGKLKVTHLCSASKCHASKTTEYDCVIRSNRGAIPSPQCALGTTPHLSIHQTARNQVEGKKEGKKRQGERRRKKEEDSGRVPRMTGREKTER